jgi:di/tricarboxylate transporter
MGLTPDAWLTIAILAATFAALVFTKLPPVTVFLGALTLCMTFGLAPIERSLIGFSNPGVLTVGALFMVAAGMYSTGAIILVTDKLVGRPKTMLAAQLKILPPITFGSAFLNNTPLVAMLIPVVRDLCRSTGLDKAKLYIPLSSASVLGGTCTLIGTATNLIIAGLVLDAIESGSGGNAKLQEITMFDPSWVAAPAAVLGLVLLMATSKFFLKSAKPTEAVADIEHHFGAEFTVPTGSPLVGQTLEATGFAAPIGFEVLALIRSDGTRVELSPVALLESGDVLVISTALGTLGSLWTMKGLVPLHSLHPMETRRFEHELIQAVISPESWTIGRRVSEFPRPDSPYKGALVAISRHGQAVPGRIRDIRVEAGDLAVVEVDESFFYVNRGETQLSLVKRVRGYRIRRWHKAAVASIITAAMISLAALGVMSMLNAALLATGAMLLTGCLTLRSAARSIDFGTLGVLAAAIGVAEAVAASGLAERIAALLTELGGGNAVAALAVVFVARVVMANLITNAGSAVFMFPIALSIADQLGVSFMPFAIALMTGTIGSVINPAAYQTNLMVYGPGGYEFSDFVKMGVPLTLLVGVVTVALAPRIFPF